MTNKTTEIIVATTEQPPEAEAPKPNPFPFFPNFNFNFNLQQIPFPFFQPKHKDKTTIPKQKQQQGQEEDSIPSSKRSLVSFPNTQLAVPPPLQAQPDEDLSNAKTSNPLILYQVYAIAGVLVARWIWGRWKERKGRGSSPNDDRDEGRHSDDDDGHGSLDNE